MFGDAGRHTIQHIALMDFGQGLHGIVFFLRLEGSLEQLFDGFPSVLNDGLALGFELVALAGERDLRFCVGVLLAGRTQKAHPDKIENFLLRLREYGNILLFKLDGRGEWHGDSVTLLLSVTRAMSGVTETPEKSGSWRQTIEMT